uniref:Uncharacterized protein n=1 Tax=Arundo donax TaxID=35708 RepID=A0A0A8YE83_ARUDO
MLRCLRAPSMVHLLTLQQKFLVLTIHHMEILEVQVFLDLTPNMMHRSQTQCTGTKRSISLGKENLR